MTDWLNRINLIKRKLNLEQLKRQVKEVEAQSSRPEFWQDQQTAAGRMKKMAAWQKELAEIEELDKLLKEGRVTELAKKIAQAELKTFFAGKYDSAPVIFAIHAGQGGTEAMDWVAMLKRMYLRYFENKGWDYEQVDEVTGEEAGIKSVIFKVNAPYAYGYLKHEAGTHRLVRQSPFNADHLRQTSFALVEVLPQIESATEVQINQEDLEWDFFRASSKGGQNVQKVSTAVRLRHKPTGIIISSQAQRYQQQNREIALELLRTKLWSKQQLEAKKEETALKGGRTKASWGTQIRSYVLHPYKMVKDLRTGFESGEPDKVLGGQLEEFIEAEVKQLS